MSHGFDGLPDITGAKHLLCDNDDKEVYFKLYLLLYADDTVTFAGYICGISRTITCCLKLNVFILPDIEIRS